MLALKNVLVAVDFDAASDTAAEYGRHLARSFGARLHLLHVMENPFLRAVANDPREVESGTIRQLQNRLTDTDRTELQAVAAVRTSDQPAEEIVRYARNERVDLIVLGAHSRPWLGYLLVGSVAERVVRTAPCPVLTVRRPERDFIAAESGTATLGIRNILVATDFGEAADAALRYGRALARACRSTLHVLNVVTDDYASVAFDAYVGVVPPMQYDLEGATRDRLERLAVVDNDAAPVPVKTAVIRSAATAGTIVGYAGANAVDLIIVGTHGRGAIGHALMGSVAERIVRSAPCPVLTVRHSERDFVVPDTIAGGTQVAGSRGE